ncbi:MAG: hypothetical protein Q9191_000532 [Dirinaria sp. TL-2023a]
MLTRSLRTSKAFTTFVVSVAIFTDILLQNLVVPVLPYALHSRIGLQKESEIQKWTSILSSAFGGAFMVGSLLFGYVGDIIPSRRALFVSGLVIVFLSTLFFALATNLWVLLAARLLEGFSTAIVTTVGYVLLTNVVGPEQLGKAMGYTSIALSLGLMSGPVVGGFLYEYCGYFSVFCPVFGLVVLEVILRMMIVGENERASPSPEATTHKASSIEAPTTDHLPPTATPAESQPLLNSEAHTNSQPVNAYKALLTSPRFIVALIGLFVLNGIACGFDSILTPYLRATFDLHSSQAAALFVALAMPMLLAPLLGSVTDRFGPRFPTAVGLTLAVPSLTLLSLISQNTSSPIPKLAILIVFLGLAFALALPPLQVEVSLVVEQMEKEGPGRFGGNGAYGRAYSLVNLVVAAAGLVGPLYAGFVRVAAGWRVLQWSNAALCAVVLVLVVLVTGGKGKKR